MIFAKQIDYTPDFTSDAYWDTHNIALVTVVAANQLAGRLHITHRVEEQFSDGPMEATRTEPLHRYWFGMYVVEPPSLGVKDHLVVAYPKQGPSQIVTFKVSPQEPLVRSLRRIQGLRAGQGGAQALADAALGSDETVSVYALKRALAQPPSRKRPAFVAKLREERADAARAPLVRVLASQLANQLEGKPSESESEYAWLTSALAKLREKDWTRLRPFTERLLEFGSRRRQTAKLLAAIATNARDPQPLRIGAYAAFDDPRLFNFGKPDAPSEEIFAASSKMLQDNDELIRRAGVALLHNLSVRIAPPLRGQYVDRAKKAIQARASVERDPGVKFHCETYLGQLEHAPSK